MSYEMRISDWSSDVCSSDLLGLVGRGRCPLPSRRNGVASMAPRRRELSLPWPSRRTRQCMPRSGNPGLAHRIVGLPNIDTLTLHHCLRGVKRSRALSEFDSNQCPLCAPTSCSAVWDAPSSASAAPGEGDRTARGTGHGDRSEEHTSELQSLMRNSNAVFCLT